MVREIVPRWIIFMLTPGSLTIFIFWDALPESGTFLACCSFVWNWSCFFYKEIRALLVHTQWIKQISCYPDKVVPPSQCVLLSPLSIENYRDISIISTRNQRSHLVTSTNLAIVERPVTTWQHLHTTMVSPQAAHRGTTGWSPLKLGWKIATWYLKNHGKQSIKEWFIKLKWFIKIMGNNQNELINLWYPRIKWFINSFCL